MAVLMVALIIMFDVYRAVMRRAKRMEAKAAMNGKKLLGKRFGAESEDHPPVC